MGLGGCRVAAAAVLVATTTISCSRSGENTEVERRPSSTSPDSVPTADSPLALTSTTTMAPSQPSPEDQPVGATQPRPSTASTRTGPGKADAPTDQAAAALPREGTFRYAVRVARSSTVRKIDPDSPDSEPTETTILVSKDDSTATETVSATDPDGLIVRQQRKSSGGGGSGRWLDLTVRGGELLELRNGSENDTCEWDKPTPVVGPPVAGAQWDEHTSCEWHIHGEVHLRYRKTSGTAGATSTWSHDGRRYKAMEVTTFTEEFDRGVLSSSETTGIYLIELGAFARKATVFKYKSENNSGENRIEERLTDINV